MAFNINKSILSITSIVILTSQSISVESGLKEIGKEKFEEMEKNGLFYKDPKLQGYLNRIGNKLVDSSDYKKKESFTFRIVDDGTINAFAMPGGYIYVNRGLLNYLNSEAEFAGIVGHEIAHVTANHHSEGTTSNVIQKIASFGTYMLTGSGNLASAAQMYGAEVGASFGRKRELEADRLGANYIAKNGYDVEAIIDALSTMKYLEMHQRLSGNKPSSYHGLYASHPRSDRRLKEIIKSAKQVETDEENLINDVTTDFRKHMQDLPWGDHASNKRIDQRYYHNNLGFTVELPDGWNVNATSGAVIAQSDDGDASLRIMLRKRDVLIKPEETLKNLSTGKLSSEEALDQFGLKGYTALASDKNLIKRVAVIDQNYSYLFEGSAKDIKQDDPILLKIIKSFRSMTEGETITGPPLYVRYIRVPRGQTVASLAAKSPIPETEATHRLINGIYPRGEPRTGDWFKVIGP